MPLCPIFAILYKEEGVNYYLIQKKMTLAYIKNYKNNFKTIVSLFNTCCFELYILFFAFFSYIVNDNKMMCLI